ncbi:MAG: hypothetical protein IJT94_09905, partial [Oscillibacter sp.]|nr:hypothetical protein [Oscillibacter sp.]
MNGNQWYRRALACVLSVLLLASLAGCGGADGGAVAGDGTAGTDRPVPAEGVSKGGGPALPTDVENNGGDFVRVGGKVYFRCYGPDALNKTAVFGIFTNAWNYTGRESQILSYDLASGQVQEVLTQGGYGPLYYGDGGFYLQERTGERDRVVWHSLDGAQSEYLCNGTVEGITSGGLLAVRWDCGPMDSADQFRLYRNTALVCAADLTGDEQFAGLTEDGLFYLLEDTVETEAGEGEPSRLRSLWQLAADGTQIPLGVLPPVEDDFIMSSEIDGFVEGRAVVGLNIGYYAGTAHALQTSTYVSAVPGRADSLTVLEVPEKLYTDGDEPYLTGDGDGSYLTADADGEIAFAPCALDAVEAWWDTGDLVRFDGQDWETLLPAYAATPEDGIGYRKIVQSAQWVDGAAYVCTACVHAAPAENIGWRDAYTLLGMEYLRVTPDGQIDELAFVDHNAILCGFAWFLEGDEALLWQEEGSLDGWSEEVNTVYRIPIAPGAVWDGGKETILSHASRASLTELDEASYYGYPIPDTGTDELLYLRLNRYGEAVFLTETSPDALLSIQIGMPESELDGAVEALNLQRRVSDEDTPWYWA